MTKIRPTDPQEILDQVFSEAFFTRLRDYVDSDDRINDLQEGTSDLTKPIQGHLVDDAPSSIDNEDVEKILGADHFRDQLFLAITKLTKPHPAN